MPDQERTIFIEIPQDVAQQEMWDVEKKLKQVEGVATDLQEPRDLSTVTVLVLHFATSVMGPIAVIGGGIKSIHDVSKIIYDFLHSKDKDKKGEKGKKKVVITKKGKKIEIYDLSIEEIEKVLRE